MDFIPSNQEEEELTKIIHNFIKKLNITNASVILGGSGAKGTWLRVTKDIDIFVQYDYKKYQDKDISNLLENDIKKKFKYQKLHGSRDYFQIEDHGYNFEIVPILAITKVEQAKNITDISPFHIDWVNSNINNLANDVRKLKAFCHANGIYGAESYIGGFSGYVLEILTIHYNGFEKVLKAACKWKDKQIIDFQGYYKNKDAIKILNKAKINSPLIIIDPVQADRNAAAALGYNAYNKFKQLAFQYIKKPSNNFFLSKGFELKKLRLRKAIIIKIKPKPGKHDVVGAKLFKTFNFVKAELIRNDFKIRESGWYFNDEIYFWFILEKNKLAKTVKHYGPYKYQKEHSEEFIKKWRKQKVKTDKKRLFVIIPRKYVNAKDLILANLKRKEIKQRLISVKIY